MSAIPAWVALVGVTAISSACVDTRNCHIVPNSNSNAYQLSYRFDQQDACPLPLAYRTQSFRIGGVVTDGAPTDFAMESISVLESHNIEVAWNPDLFQTVGGARTAHPVVAYPAGTGLAPNLQVSDPPQEATTDHATFVAYFNTSQSSYSNASGTVYIVYKKSPILANVAGPDLPLRNTAASWTCTGSGGAAPYTYRWYRNGQLVSQTSSYATTVDTADFGLRAEATDANGVVGYLDMLVDVDGIRGTISGPNIVYYSQGGGTWTASGRGGANSYVFDWYTWDDMSTTWQWVGSGSSWTGYPGEGNTEVLLKTTNGTPEHNDIARPVTGIGNESCAPVPPAVTCEG